MTLGVKEELCSVSAGEMRAPEKVRITHWLRTRSRGQAGWMHTLALVLVCCVTSGHLLNLSVPQIPKG